MMFIQIKMVQLKRYKFILIGLALFAVLLVYSELPRRFFSVGGILRGPFKLPPKSNATDERYELVHKYEQERLPDVAFKRILFWNDVRTSFDLKRFHLVDRNELNYHFSISISGFLIIKSDSAVMPCANGIARYGSAKFPTIAPMPRTTTLSSFTFAAGLKEICHNVGHLTSATFSGLWSLLPGRNTWTQVRWPISSTGP
jgi:hypothetical protein